MNCPLRCYTGKVVNSITRSFLWVRNYQEKKEKINKKYKNKHLGQFSSSVLTAPLTAAGCIIILKAVTQKYRSRCSAACILQFASIFLQVSLYGASHFPTLSGSSIFSAHYPQATSTCFTYFP